MILDLRYGIRTLLKAPGFALVALLTLALGIGANTAVFSLAHAIFLAPLPFPDDERLVVLGEQRGSSGAASLPLSGHEYVAWNTQNRSFDRIALVHRAGLTLTGAGDPASIEVASVSRDFFPVLGVRPSLGRAFEADDAGPGADRAVVLSDALWRRRFRANPAIVGQSVALDDEMYTVVGVMPALPAALAPDAWLPLDVPAQARAVGRHNLNAIGRLRSGVTLERARADLELISARLARELPRDNTDHHPKLTSLRESLVGDVRAAWRLLLLAVGFVLLIACANVANLLLTRGAHRQKEIAVRLALGAGRARVIRQLLVESVLLAFLGGTLGLLFAAWIVDLVPRITSVSLPLADTARLDWFALAFAFGISLTTGLVAGLAPAMRCSHQHVARLKEGTRMSDDRGRSRLRATLVGTEVALTTVLLLGAGLMIHSFARLVSVDPGFRTDHALVVPVDLPGARYASAAQQREFYDRLLAKLQATPGVERVGATSHLPLGGSDNWMAFSIEGRPAPPPGQALTAAVRTVTPDYFRALGIPLEQGRFFDTRDARLSVPLIRWYPQQPAPPDADKPQAIPVALVSDATARQYWPGENPVGKRIRLLFSPEITIVGVVGDVKHNELSAPAYPHIYLAHNQEPWSSVSFVIRTTGAPAQVGPAVRERLRAMDPSLPVSVRTLDDVVDASVGRPRFYAVLIGLFGTVALGLAIVGIVGVVGYVVTQRTKEIGVRIALGAQRGEILRLVVRQGMQPIAVGMCAGVIAGFVLMRFIRSLLFRVDPTDPLTLALAVLVMTGVALLACWVPARRAAGLDPVTALRGE
jgi:putative ABC transport system permease protein